MSATPEAPRRHPTPVMGGVGKASSCLAPLVFLLGLLLVSASAQAIEVGERLAPWTLEDQFGDTVTLDEQTSLLRIPGLVAKFVLVPSMRSANYRALLDRENRVAPQPLGGDDNGTLAGSR
ncbi:hypothetical protein [Halomonas cerina]|uniref:Uncharacterized protein n=1 Tax=Halomonas cerina TaxID=447424 RepID=A0A839V584_9GAMM|nr:hypothetical protein [Halomonas cerina]MBB3190552.1 hypothetical protein [Halomonas cerina]